MFVYNNCTNLKSVKSWDQIGRVGKLTDMIISIFQIKMLHKKHHCKRLQLPLLLVLVTETMLISFGWADALVESVKMFSGQRVMLDLRKLIDRQGIHAQTPAF